MLITDAWRQSTKKTYSIYLRKWSTFCLEKNVNMLDPSLPQACRFLRDLSHKGLGYGALNTARSALSTILPSYEGHPFGQHPHVCWLVKGAYERNPPKARYSEFWDVNKVFNLFKSWGPSGKLPLRRLSLKLAVLLLLVTSQRGQTILNLSTEQMIKGESFLFKMKVLLKHNRLGDPLDTIILRPFATCKRLCVVSTLRVYLKKTECVRGHGQLLLSFLRPHAPISRDTLSRWTVQVLRESGVDVTKYKGHSTRGASTSAARRLGVPTHLILKQASWKSAESFAKFYDKELESDPTEVGRALLQQVQ